MSQICVVAIVKSFDANIFLLFVLCIPCVKDEWTLKFMQHSVPYFTKLLEHHDKVWVKTPYLTGSSIHPTRVTY